MYDDDPSSSFGKNGKFATTVRIGGGTNGTIPRITALDTSLRIASVFGPASSDCTGSGSNKFKNVPDDPEY